MAQATWKRTRRAAGWVVTGLAVLVIAACVAVLLFLIFFEEHAEKYTTGVPPKQFHAQLADDLLDDYAGVFGVAHNSGDAISTTKEALRHSTDVIEIDVVISGGRLRAAHDSILPWIGERFFRGPSLDEVWALVERAEVVKLDLKEGSRSYLETLDEFLDEHPHPQVVIATRDVSSLEFMAEHQPQAIRLLSVSNHDSFERLQADESTRELIDGVTIRESVVDAEVAEWLEEEQYITLAWTVNDLPRVNQLVRMGVDAITTDNLAIMELLGGQSRQEALLTTRDGR